MKIIFLTPLIALVVCSCVKSRTCTCYDKNGDKMGTITVTAGSDKKGIEKCQVALYNSGDKKKAKEMVATDPPDCRIE